MVVSMTTVNIGSYHQVSYVPSKMRTPLEGDLRITLIKQLFRLSCSLKEEIRCGQFELKRLAIIIIRAGRNLPPKQGLYD